MITNEDLDRDQRIIEQQIAQLRGVLSYIRYIRQNRAGAAANANGSAIGEATNMVMADHNTELP